MLLTSILFALDPVCQYHRVLRPCLRWDNDPILQRMIASALSSIHLRLKIVSQDCGARQHRGLDKKKKKGDLSLSIR